MDQRIGSADRHTRRRIAYRLDHLSIASLHKAILLGDLDRSILPAIGHIVIRDQNGRGSLRFIVLRKVACEMQSATLFAPLRGLDDQVRDIDEIA